MQVIRHLDGHVFHRGDEEFAADSLCHFLQLLVGGIRFQRCDARDGTLCRAHLFGDILLSQAQGIFQEIEIRQERRQRLVHFYIRVKIFVALFKGVHEIQDLILFHSNGIIAYML